MVYALDIVFIIVARNILFRPTIFPGQKMSKQQTTDKAALSADNEKKYSISIESQNSPLLASIRNFSNCIADVCQRIRERLY
jgi:hypothetical protein